MADSWVRRQAPGCGGRILLNGHTECLRHSSCTQEHVYNPSSCPMCREAATTILTQPAHLAISHLKLLQARLRYLQKLASHDKATSSWGDPKLTVCLGLACWTSPTPSLSHLLSDTVRTKQTFEGFPPSSATPSHPHEVEALPLPTSEHQPPAHTTMSANLQEPPRKRQKCRCREKSPTRYAFPPSTVLLHHRLPSVLHLLLSHLHSTQGFLL